MCCDVSRESPGRHPKARSAWRPAVDRFLMQHIGGVARMADPGKVKEVKAVSARSLVFASG